MLYYLILHVPTFRKNSISKLVTDHVQDHFGRTVYGRIGSSGEGWRRTTKGEKGESVLYCGTALHINEEIPSVSCAIDDCESLPYSEGKYAATTSEVYGLELVSSIH